jgi:hypothetical protein
MTTITVNERTKAGKTLLELAKILSASNIGVSIDTGFSKPNESNELTPKQKTLINKLNKVAIDVKSGNFKGNPIEQLLNDL